MGQLTEAEMRRLLENIMRDTIDGEIVPMSLPEVEALETKYKPVCLSPEDRERQCRQLKEPLEAFREDYEGKK